MTGLMNLPISGILAVAAILFAAGMTKGIVGVGLPTVAVPLLSIMMPLPAAVAALTIPVFVTNLTQASGADRMRVVMRTLWPILAGTAGGIVVGVHFLTGLNPHVLKPMVGVVLIGVAVSMLLAPKLHCPERFAPIASPIAGIGSGLFGGLAGQCAPILSLYLLSRGITGDRFVQYSSIYLVFASAALTLALGNSGAFGWIDAAISSACLLPILLGMWVGQWLRAGVPAALSRKLVLCIVVLGGISMVHIPLYTVFAAPPI
jgi:uncharacterized membrane protein YfcA